MKFRFVKIVSIVIAFLLHAPVVSAAEDIDWQFGSEPIHEKGVDSPVIGTFWALGARKDDIQITFSLETSTDMKRGGWVGDIRAPEKFYVKVYLIDDIGEKRFFNLKNGRAVGPDTEYGNWKKGPSTATEQMLQFDFSWEEILMVKNSKTIVLGYAHYDTPENSKDITIPLENFNAWLNELTNAVNNMEGGARFVMTKEEIYTTPLNDLPKALRNSSLKDVKQISKEISVPVVELLALSKNEIQKLRIDHAKATKDAKQALTKKAHQAIYDQEPKWFDINVCPKPDVSYCNDIGKTAYHDGSVATVEGERLVTAMAVKYGKIFGVVWRSKGSIIKIYPGDIKWDRDPTILRAPKAEYYHIIKYGDYVQVKPSAKIYAKN